MKIKKKLLGAVFFICFMMIFALTGTYEQDKLTTPEYLIYSAADLLVLTWTGIRGGILEKPVYKKR